MRNIESIKLNSDKSLFDVYIIGGDDYIYNINPNFKIVYNNLELYILIPSIKEWQKNKNLMFLNIKNDDTNIDLKFLTEKISLWFEEKYELFDEVTNLEMLRIQWNVLNSDNILVNKFDKTY